VFNKSTSLVSLFMVAALAACGTTPAPEEMTPTAASEVKAEKLVAAPEAEAKIEAAAEQAAEPKKDDEESK
jgi:hypothetical protein